MCFGIRILSLFHLNTSNIPIQNIKCTKNTKNASADNAVRTDDGSNTLKHISCFEEEMTKLCKSLSSLITYPSTKHCTEQCDSWIALSVTQIGFGMPVQRRHSSSFTNNGWGENDVRACVFGVFRALNILNGYV